VRLSVPPLLVALLLSGCASVVPSTMAQLARLDPLTADPAAMELLVILPAGLAVKPGSARLEFGATRGKESRMESFALLDRAVTNAPTPPDRATARGFGLAPEDAAKMRALQAEIALWKQDGAAKGTLGIGLGGCAVDGGPAADAVGSVFIRVTEAGPFLPLITEGRLSDLLGQEVLAAIKPCNGAE
jgi:hypothetical protein